MSAAIRPEHLKELHGLELKLKIAARVGNLPGAEEAMREIKTLLKSYGDHHRLLECKLWFFETLLDANQPDVAESGFEGIRQKAGKGTRLYIEASFFLGICLLRQKKIAKAKELLRRVLKELNKIQSPDTRQFLQQRIIERIEEEAVLTELIGAEEGLMKPDSIHAESIKIVQQPEHEIYELLGRSIPYRAFQLLREVRQDAILQLTLPDRKLLPAPGHASQAHYVGKRAFTVLKRVGWKTFCDPTSALFKLWSQRSPKVFNEGYFASATAATFQNWQIGIPILAAGVAAIMMKHGAEEFCTWTRPESIMEARRSKMPKAKRT
jgi:hypothetical protein